MHEQEFNVTRYPAVEFGETSPSSGCRHLLPACGEKGNAAPSRFSTNLSQGTSPLPVRTGRGLG